MCLCVCANVGVRIGLVQVIPSVTVTMQQSFMSYFILIGIYYQIFKIMDLVYFKNALWLEHKPFNP